MTKTQRHTGRDIRLMLRKERVMEAAEKAGNWDAYSAAKPTMEVAANNAVAAGVSWKRLLRVGR